MLRSMFRRKLLRVCLDVSNDPLCYLSDVLGISRTLYLPTYGDMYRALLDGNIETQGCEVDLGGNRPETRRQ